MTKEEIAEILKKARIQAGLTQKQASEKLGRKQQTLASWEIGQSQPDANTLFELFSIYGVSVDESFGFSPKRTSQSECSDFSSQEYEIIKKYRSLDPRGRQAVQDTLDREFGYSVNISNADIATDMMNITEKVDHHIINQSTPTDKK